MSKRGRKQNRERKAKRAVQAVTSESVMRLVRLMREQLDEDRRRKQTKVEAWLTELQVSSRTSARVVILGVPYPSEEVQEALRLVRSGANVTSTPLVITGGQLIDLYAEALNQTLNGKEQADLKAALLLERARCQAVAREDAQGTVRVTPEGVRVLAREVVDEVEQRWTDLDLPPKPAPGIESPLQATLEVDERRAMIAALLEKADEASAILITEDTSDYFFVNLEDIHLDRFARCIATVMEVPALSWAPGVFHGRLEFAESLVRAEREAWPEDP